MMSLIDLGIAVVSSYWMTLVVGTACMAILIYTRRFVYSLSTVRCLVTSVILTVVGVLGAKILYIAENLPEVLRNGINLGGVSFYGSVWLIPVLMPLLGYVYGLGWAQSLDLCAPCVAVMIGCLRVGCFLNGCCGGWEMCLGELCFRWPTQAVESLGDFAIFVWLMQKEEAKKDSGNLYPLFMISYSAMRFLIEFFRDTPKDWLLMSHGQWFALASIVCGVIWITFSRKRASRT